MNSIFTAKLLQNLRNKKGDKGFTLIELLVVVIIIGVLAAVALPNLLAQVGKARETEGKTGVGTIVRAQQTYHFETQAFTNQFDNDSLSRIGSNDLGISVTSQYFSFGTAATPAESYASAAANGFDANNDGVRSYSGGIRHDAGNYAQVLCQTNGITPTPATINVDVITGVTPDCGVGNKAIK